ncbi:zinc finger, CCHC-type containing protein [Tanacetum coccineum]
MTTSVGNNSVFKSFFEKQKLTGPNFIDWYRQLRLVLSTEDNEQYLEQPISAAPVAAAPDQPIPLAALATYNEWVNYQKEIAAMLLLTMDLEIQRNLVHLGANDMLKELKALYSKQAEQELLQTVREFHMCKQEECQSVSSYVLKMKSYIDELERLGHLITLNLKVSLILVGVSKEYDSFVQNYNMHNMQEGPEKTKTEPSRAAKGVFKGQGFKGKKGRSLEKELSYISHRVAEKEAAISRSLNFSKKLNPGALSLYMGNGQRAAVEAIGNYHLYLPSGLGLLFCTIVIMHILLLEGIILVYRLYEDGFINSFELNNAIFVSKNNVVYFSAIPRDGVYEIEMSCSNTNDSSMYAVSNKRAKLNLDSSLLWHCRLGHISKKRPLQKLQLDGLLNSITLSL